MSEWETKTWYRGPVEMTETLKKSVLPTDAMERKAIPVYTGVIDYFPDAIVRIAKLSLEGGMQHGQTASTLHWDRTKSMDHLDSMMRHMLDGDWAEVAWRALANLQIKIEEGYYND